MSVAPYGGAGGEARVEIVASFPRRGRKRLEPPALRVADPIGLAPVFRRGSDRLELLVLPRTEPVNWSRSGAAGNRHTPAHGLLADAFAASEVDGLRPYRPGTPASRIHWAALARGAGLLERRMRAEQESRPLIVLDSRCAEEVSQRLDMAVRAAASLVLDLARRGGCGLLTADGGRALEIDSRLAGWPAARTRLALIAPGRRAPALAAHRRPGQIFYVAAEPVGRPPQILLETGGMLVLPTSVGAPEGCSVAFTVCGCVGYELRPRGGRGLAPVGPGRRGARMSASAPALAPAVGPRGAQTGARAAGASAARPLVRIGAFAGLALFGALRWGALMTPAPTGRLLGLVAIAVALVVAGPWTAQRSRAAAILLAGARRAGHAARLRPALVLAASRAHRGQRPRDRHRPRRAAAPARPLPRGQPVGADGAVARRGAADLRRRADARLRRPSRGDAGARRAPGPREPEAGDLRRAIASLPLIALAAVPLTLVPARFQYAEGAVMFGLLAALVWGERLPRRGAGTAAFICGLACAAAMVAAPWLDARTPWIHYQTLGAGIGLEAQENFDWSQRYGPLNWPRDGRLVLEVAAPRADYWKAVNLEMFDGRQWAQAQNGLDPGAEGDQRRARARAGPNRSRSRWRR